MFDHFIFRVEFELNVLFLIHEWLPKVRWLGLHYHSPLMNIGKLEIHDFSMVIIASVNAADEI